MKKTFSQIIGCLTLVCLPWVAQATDLLQVYQQALANDPQYKQAEAQMLSDKELLPIGYALLLPNIDLTGSLTKVEKKSSTGSPLTASYNHYHDTNTSYGATLTQPLFNFAAWAGVRSAKASVKAAVATYNAASQDLILRTAAAYFAVLQANDVLTFNEAEKRALANQLAQTQERFKVGLIAITDVEQAQASYDSQEATTIASQNTVADNLEKLREITGTFYKQLSGVSDTMPFISPMPENINAWTEAAIHQNYTLQAAHFATIAQREAVKVQRAQGYPVLNAIGGYTFSHDSNNGINDAQANQRNISGGLQINFPIFQGGGIAAKTRQQAYLYSKLSAVEEQTYRQVLSQTSQNYLNVLADISQVQAGAAAVKSAKSALDATEAGYSVGTQTFLNVLQSQQALYSAMQNHAIAVYAYLIDNLSLKLSTGSLSVNDLASINRWLTKNIDFSAYSANAANLNVPYTAGRS